MEGIVANRPDAETLALAAVMAHAERSAEATAENYLLDAGSLSAALHHTLPFVGEVQKLAKDARYKLMTGHMVGCNGDKPVATTINGKAKNLLTHVVVYPTSRPGVRYVLDGAVDFTHVVDDVKADVHCDVAVEPFAGSLQQYKFVGKADCISDMAEDAATQRTRVDYWENELKVVAPQYRERVRRPQPVAVGNLIPVAFGSDIVLLKLCAEHVLALLTKYGIRADACGVEEPWESTANYW